MKLHKNKIKREFPLRK